MSSLSSKQKGSVEEFRGITGASDAQASKLLKTHKFVVERAVNAWYESGMVSDAKPAKEDSSVSTKQLEEEFAQLEDKSDPGKITGDGILAIASALGIDAYRCARAPP
jgi:transposase